MNRRFDADQLRRELAEPTMQVEMRWAPGFLALCLVALVSFFLWAGWAEISEITRGQGKVIPSSKQQSIQSLEGGILDRLLVMEGQVVAAGQVLAQLDETRFRTAFEEASSQARALEAMLARLQTEVLGKENIEFPSHLNVYTELVHSERELFVARRQRLAATELAVREEINANQQQLTILEGLNQSQAVGALELMKLNSKMAELNGRLTEFRNMFVQEAYTELAAKKSELLALQQIIEQRQDQLNRTRLISPVRGVVHDIAMATRGGVIAPGDEIMQIIPLEDKLVFETRIRPQDIAFLAPDMVATVKISAYDFTVYGGLNGKIERISTDTLVEDTPRGEESYYKVLVSTPQSFLNHGDKKLPIKPGMLAEIDIQTAQRTVLEYLLKPLKMLELR